MSKRRYKNVRDVLPGETATPMIYAIIGTREPSAAQCQMLDTLVQGLATKPATLRTGAAQGIDQRAAEQWPHELVLVLPWDSYERAWVDQLRGRRPVTVEIYNARSHPAWTQSVAQYHPAPRALRQGAWSLHARNYGIVYGVDHVFAFPRTATDWGGTGQGMRIARGLGIPLTVLGV